MSAPNDEYNDAASAPVTKGYIDKGPNSSTVPVVKDSEAVSSGVNPDTEDSDETLTKNDNEAIDKSNIIDSRTRGAKPVNTYREPGDTEGLPDNDGGSAVSGGPA